MLEKMASIVTESSNHYHLCRILVLVLILCLTQSGQCQRDQLHCSKDWHRIADKCYKSIPNFLGSFVTAESACRVRARGRLAMPKALASQLTFSSVYFNPKEGHLFKVGRALWIGVKVSA